jgi:hypothetical protein
MEGRLISVIVVVVIIAAVAGVMIMSPGTNQPSTIAKNQPTQSEQQSVVNTLEQGMKIDLAAPDRTNWPKGSNGVFTLGIRNDNTQVLFYYLNVYLKEYRGDPGAAQEIAKSSNNWFSYSVSNALPVSGIKYENIVMNVPGDAPEGLYLFSVAVCKSSDCTGENTENHYATTGFSVRVV